VDDNAVKTLFLPFHSGELPVPGPDERWLFLNAVPPAADEPEFRRSLMCVQGFRPAFLALERAGYRALPELDASAEFSGALVLLGKHRELNRTNIHAALTRTLENAPLLIAGSRTSGVESMRKEIAGLVPVDSSWSKHHAQVFKVTSPAHWALPAHDSAPRVETNGFSFETAPGMFSHKAIDAGSAVLARRLNGLKGRVADLGAGWGYLSWVALCGSPEIDGMSLYEADFASLRAADANLHRFNPHAPVSFHWSDLAQEPPKEKFDAVIMNPPFHAGRQSDPDLGKRLIGVAATSLKPGGQLLMVANKQLPYEDTLQHAFRRFDRIDEDRLFKVIRALR
jgi:16S rRNA (guanine1207-N2)-methyltransferase